MVFSIPATEDKSPNRLSLTQRHRHDLLNESSCLLDLPGTGDCSSLGSSCSPCPGGIASYPSLLSTSPTPTSPIGALKTAETTTTNTTISSDSSYSILLQFAEGINPQPPEDIDPSTPLHVMPLSHEVSPLRRRRRWKSLRNALKSSAGFSEFNDDEDDFETPSHDGLRAEETFDTAEDALQVGMVYLVPCPHLPKAVVETEKGGGGGAQSHHHPKPHSFGQKSKFSRI